MFVLGNAGIYPNLRTPQLQHQLHIASHQHIYHIATTKAKANVNNHPVFLLFFLEFEPWSLRAFTTLTTSPALGCKTYIMMMLQVTILFHYKSIWNWWSIPLHEDHRLSQAVLRQVQQSYWKAYTIGATKDMLSTS